MNSVAVHLFCNMEQTVRLCTGAHSVPQSLSLVVSQIARATTSRGER